MSHPTGDTNGERDPWARPQAPSGEPELDPNDPYRYGRPDPDPNDPYRFGPPQQPAQPPPQQPTQPPVQPPQQFPQYPGQPYSQQPYGPPGYPGQDPGQYPPGQYPGQPPYPPQYSPYPQPGNRNGLAIAALVLGVLGLVFSWIPIFGAILGILGVIFGAVGLRAAARTGGAGRGLALAGLICGAIGTVICVIWSVVIITRVSNCSQYSADTPSYDLCIRNG